MENNSWHVHVNHSPLAAHIIWNKPNTWHVHMHFQAITSYLIAAYIWWFSTGINRLWLLQSTENPLPMDTFAQKGLFSTLLASVKKKHPLMKFLDFPDVIPDEAQQVFLLTQYEYLSGCPIFLWVNVTLHHKPRRRCTKCRTVTPESRV